MASKRTVLIVGASGVIGQAAIGQFVEAGFDRVVGLSRRPADVPAHPAYEHLALDLMDEGACRAAVATLSDVTHVVYAALFEKPGLVAGWQERDQMETNLRMMRNLMGPLVAAADNLAHVSVFQGTKAYGAHVHPIAVPAREDRPRDAHENFYWLQEDYMRDQRRDADWTLTIWRPQVVFGGATGVAMNIIPVLAAYAAICRELDLPFAYPGRPGGVGEAVDADLIGRALVWAADAPQAGDQTYNITNGDVYAWVNVWPTIAQTLGMEPAWGEPFSLADFLIKHASVWDRIVAREGLRPLSIEQICGESHYYADLLMGVHAPDDVARDPILVSTIKLRQAGFGDCVDTEAMFVKWLDRMAERRIAPAPTN